jgi:hypothetical protein
MLASIGFGGSGAMSNEICCANSKNALNGKCNAGRTTLMQFYQDTVYP